MWFLHRKTQGLSCRFSHIKNESYELNEYTLLFTWVHSETSNSSGGKFGFLLVFVAFILSQWQRPSNFWTIFKHWYIYFSKPQLPGCHSWFQHTQQELVIALIGCLHHEAWILRFRYNQQPLWTGWPPNARPRPLNDHKYILGFIL